MPEPRPRRNPITATVLRTQWLSASLVRLTLGGEELRSFEASPCADSYVKALFTVDGEDAPRKRSYTVRAFDPDALELTLDFVVHGAAGIAGPWAASATPGDELQLLGPGGSYTPDPDADHHLLVGDLSALPAIAVALERLPDGARGDVLLEVHGPEDEIALEVPDGITLQWVHQGDAQPGWRLVEATRALAWPVGRVHAFVHGEAGAVKELRRYLRIERRVPLEALSISGYWRSGEDDEGWRAAKREWNAAIEAAEAAVPVG